MESKYEGVAPKLVLLTLLAEVCSVTLTRHQLNNLTEVESLFLILTHIQRDLMTEAPGQMTLIVNCLREAFLTASAPAQVYPRNKNISAESSRVDIVGCE